MIDMQKSAFNILRIGLAVTFFWIGVLIWRSPAEWATFIQPWAAKLISGSLVFAMQQTAILDMAVGVLLLVSPLVWLGALLGALHLAIVLITVGVNGITIRDVGLVSATIALCIETFPQSIKNKILSLKRSK